MEDTVVPHTSVNNRGLWDNLALVLLPWLVPGFISLVFTGRFSCRFSLFYEQKENEIKQKYVIWLANYITVIEDSNVVFFVFSD